MCQPVMLPSRATTEMCPRERWTSPSVLSARLAKTGKSGHRSVVPAYAGCGSACSLEEHLYVPRGCGEGRLHRQQLLFGGGEA